MINGKKKGNSGERELLNILYAYGLEAQRNDQQYVGGKDNPDVSCSIAGVPLHIEVKRVERLNIHEAMRQAQRDANGHALPVVAHRKNREAWMVTVPLRDVLGLLIDGCTQSKGAAEARQGGQI